MRRAAGDHAKAICLRAGLTGIFLGLDRFSTGMKEALHWHEKDGKVVCDLCPRACVLKDGQTGACGVRQALKGKLFAMTYAKPCSTHVDPVEKKPLYHFYPGEGIFSIATIGCNLFCDFCQNWEISKAKHDELEAQEELSPHAVIRRAEDAGCRLIAFTYTEPTIFFEYALDIAKEAKKAGMECVIVSNGYTSEAATKQWAPYLSAANIDLKGTANFYKQRCKVPDYEPVKKTIVLLKKLGVHVEVTNLLIPGENDSPEEIEQLAKWLAKEAGRDTPLHFSAFRPEYKLLEKASTPTETLLKAREIAKKHLDHVYLGNVSGVDNNTYCPKCDAVVIERPRYQGVSHLKNGKCPECGEASPGRFSRKK